MKHPIEHYYHILELPFDASIEDIKKSYREKVKRYHPDKNTSSDHREQFLIVQQAYDIVLPYASNLQFQYSSSGANRGAFPDNVKPIDGMSYDTFKHSKHYTTARFNYKNEIFVEAATNLFMQIHFPLIAGCFLGILVFIGLFILLFFLLIPKWIHIIKPLIKFNSTDWKYCMKKNRRFSWLLYLPIPLFLLMIFLNE